MTTKPMSALVADMIPTRQNSVERLIARQEWAEQNVHDCQEDCDRMGKIAVQLEYDKEPTRVACPLFSRDCRRGKRFYAGMKKMAEESIPTAIPPRYRKTLVKADETESIRRVREWDGQGVLYIHGLTGTGKSFAAAWWPFNRIMQRLEKEWEEPYRWREITAYEMRWFTAFDICLDRANMYEARNTPMLIIDDLGCESDTITNRAIINDLIAYRYSYSVPTIITSNLDPDEMQTRYKARMYERIIQTGKVVDSGRINKRIR